MSILEYKQRLHELIDSEEDESLLEEVHRILSIKQTERDILDDLTPEQLAGLEKARKDGREGRYIPLADFKKEVNQWLKKELL